MDLRERISRRDRHQKRTPLIRIFLAVAVIVLAILIYYKFPVHKHPRPAPVVITKPVVPSNFGAIADSLVMNCCQSFGLSDTAFIDSILSQSAGPTYRRFRQGWPSGLPYIVFAQRLNNLARPKNFQCDCEESPKQGWLACTVKSGRQSGAQVLLDTSRKTKLAGREVAIVLENLGAKRGDEIIKLIKSGLVFSYYGSFDFYPSGDLFKLFGRGNITTIIKLPASDAGWAQVSRFAKGNMKGSASFDRSIMADLISRHPGAKAFVFDTLSGFDPKIVKAVNDEARHEKIAYLYTSPDPTSIDKAVQESGVTILGIDLLASDKTLNQIKFDLLGQLLSDDAPRQIAVCIDASKVEPGELVSLKTMLDSMGVKLKPYMKLTKKIENL